MDKRYGILIVCVTILVLSFVETASAANWTVDDSGGADFTEIQDAINNASVGDTIIVHSGVYYENVVVDKSVTLKGVGHPVVDAGVEWHAITLSADGITLVGFTATNSGRLQVGINVISRNNTITGNTVSNNNGKGISLYSSSNNTITGNNVRNNNKGGISLYSSSNNTITANNVSNNNDDGISLSRSSNNTITGNNVRNNHSEGISLHYSSNNNTIAGNNVSNNKWAGIELADSSNNNTITGNNVSNNDDNDDGIFLDDSSNNNTITGNNVSNNRYGISLSDSNNNTITGNNVSNNKYGGIYLADSNNNNTITGNTFVNNGLRVSSSYQNTVENNTVNGKPLVYLEDASDYKVEDAGQVILVNCNNITVENQDLSNTSVGIKLLNTENSKALNNTASNNRWAGIRLYDSCNNTVTDNNVSNNRDGIKLGDSCNNNSITGNNVSNNRDGIKLRNSCNNTITGNNVSNNYWSCIYVYDSSNNNQIYLNNFISGSWLLGLTNILNTPEKITYTYNGSTHKSHLGNYWGDYKEKYPDAEEIDSRGIWDIPYSIDGDEDSYPLMQQRGNYHL